MRNQEPAAAAPRTASNAPAEPPNPRADGKRWLPFLNERSPSGRAFEALVRVLILVSVVQFMLETVQELQPYLRWFWWSEVVIVAFFTLEFALRLATAKSRLRYLFSPAGLIDLAAILPFYLMLGDLRWIRGVRLLRVLRVAKLVRYGDAYARLYRAVWSIRHELAVYLGVTVTLLYVAAVGIYYFERDAQPGAFRSVPHAMWWAIVTLTTVGYGDVVPVTLGGRLLTAFILLLSLGIVSVPSALLASAFVKDKAEQSDTKPKSTE
jgi:voltage-gated potassium channel